MDHVLPSRGYTLATDSDDLFFAVSGQNRGYSGIGLGRAMAGSLILLVFPQTNGNVTASMRLATGRSRPALAPSSISVEVIQGVSTADRFQAGLRCRGCRSWQGGAIKVSGPQDFIYAYGSATGTEVGDQGVTTYHGPLSHGTFQFDAAAASGPGGVPQIIVS